MGGMRRLGGVAGEKVRRENNAYNYGIHSIRGNTLWGV